MPWTDSSSPNAMLEIVDTCNVCCDVCYHKPSPAIKSLSEIGEDLANAKRLRELHTVTITGGEPTLHPELCEVVEMIKEEGFHAFLLTNGLLIDEDYLDRLKQAGLDSILFHVDEGQRRDDLPRNPTFADIERRLNQLIETASAAGLDVSISTIIYDWSQVETVTRYFMAHPAITFLFLSKAVNPVQFFGESLVEQDCEGIETPGVRRLIDFFRTNHKLEPYSYIPTLNEQKTVWISYFVPILYQEGGYTLFPYKSNWADVALMRLIRLMTGRHIHKTKQNSVLTWIRISINALSRLKFVPAARFWSNSRRKGRQLRHKMIVYDDGPFWSSETDVQHCEYCPTAVIRNGTLVPCCTADYFPKAVHNACSS